MGWPHPTASECLGEKGNILRGVYVYKTPGPWRTPKWVWPDRIERQPVGPRKRPCSRYIGDWDVTNVTRPPAGSNAGSEP